MNNIQQWWSGLEARERRTLTLGGIALGIILFVFVIWLPAHRNVAELEQRLSQQQALLAWMQEHAVEAKALRGTAGAAPTNTTGQALFSLADQSARKAGLGSGIRRVEPSGDNNVRVELESVSFDSMVRWLVELRRSYGVEATVLSVRTRETAGVVDAQLVLQGSEA